jgi:hypothetical protein
MTEEKVLFSEIEIDCRKVINLHTKSFLKDKVFNLKDADFLINNLKEKIMKDLQKISEYFKYVLCVVLLQSDSSGLVQNTSSYYDIESDGIISEKFNFSNISCIVNLFSFSI